MESMFFKYYMSLYLHMKQTTKLTTVRQSYKQTPIHNFIFTKKGQTHTFSCIYPYCKGDAKFVPRLRDTNEPAEAVT